MCFLYIDKFYEIFYIIGKWVLEKKSALIKKLTFMGEMSVMNKHEYDNICKGYGLKRELGMIWFYEHPNDRLCNRRN